MKAISKWVFRRGIFVLRFINDLRDVGLLEIKGRFLSEAWADARRMQCILESENDAVEMICFWKEERTVDSEGTSITSKGTTQFDIGQFNHNTCIEGVVEVLYGFDQDHQIRAVDVLFTASDPVQQSKTGGIRLGVGLQY